MMPFFALRPWRLCVKQNLEKRKETNLAEEAEWMDYFNAQKAKVQTLQQEVDALDKQIDKMVYELYGLTEEEIGIVEGSD